MRLGTRTTIVVCLDPPWELLCQSRSQSHHKVYYHWTCPSHWSTRSMLRCPTGTELIKPLAHKSTNHIAPGTLRFQPHFYMWTTHQCLCSLTAHRGRTAPTVRTPRMRVLWAVSLWFSLWACTLTVGFSGRPKLLLAHTPGRGLDHIPGPQAVSAQITPALSLGLSSKAQVSAPSPHTHQQMWGLGWGVQEVTSTLCAGLPLFCLPWASCCTLVWAPEATFLYHWSPSWWSKFPGGGTLSSFTAPSQGHRSHPNYFFSFIIPSNLMIFLAILVGNLLPVFSRHSVRNSPHVDILLMYLQKKMSSKSFYSDILISFLVFFLKR